MKTQQNLEVSTVNVEVVDDEKQKIVAKSAEDRLIFPLTAQTLFRQVAQRSADEYYRYGIFWSARLMQECQLVLPHPIYSRAELWQAWHTWNNNRCFFLCREI